MSLRLLYEQGHFKGDLTSLQRLALAFAIADKDMRFSEVLADSTKGIQAFINPSAFQEVYKDQEESFEIDDSVSEDSGVYVDIDDPEQLDKYLEQMFKEAQRTNVTHDYS